MAAVLGLSAAQVEAVLAVVNAPRDLAAANYNSPGQVVLSGTPAALERAAEAARAAGAKRVIPLTVSAAFHSPLMEAAARRLGEALDRVEISRARFPVYANASAEPVVEAEAIREALRRQLLMPVLWEQTIRAMGSSGIRQFVEVGNGRVLRGLVRSTDREASLHGAEDPDSVEAALQALVGAAAR
jgi:[acyl-carrier-protein] S-malonyltransferase